MPPRDAQSTRLGTPDASSDISPAGPRTLCYRGQHQQRPRNLASNGDKREELVETTGIIDYGSQSTAPSSVPDHSQASKDYGRPLLVNTVCKRGQIILSIADGNEALDYGD